MRQWGISHWYFFSSKINCSFRLWNISLFVRSMSSGSEDSSSGRGSIQIIYFIKVILHTKNTPITITYAFMSKQRFSLVVCWGWAHFNHFIIGCSQRLFPFWLDLVIIFLIHLFILYYSYKRSSRRHFQMSYFVQPTFLNIKMIQFTAV